MLSNIMNNQQPTTDNVLAYESLLHTQYYEWQ